MPHRSHPGIVRPRQGRLLAASAATLALLAAQALRLPSALRDAATGEYLADLALDFPLGHLLTTPFSAVADLWTLNSARQHAVLAAWLLLGCWAWQTLPRGRRPWRQALAGYAAYLALVVAFLAWAALTPRSAARLALPGDYLALDFHSHTSRSWDGRRSFGPRANMDWHRAMGFSAAFITDHNAVEGSREAKEASRLDWTRTGYRSLEGVEVSLPGTHVVALGARQAPDPTAFGEGPEAVIRYLGRARRAGVLPILSLPEYWRNHPRERWEAFAEAGAAGFEIANASPKALDFPEPLKREAVELCRRRNLFMAGVTDSHGWGRAAYAWSVMRLPGHAAMDPDRLEKAVLGTLSAQGFGAVRVVVRAKAEPLPAPWIALDPLAGLWTLARTLTWAQTLACLAWIWVPTLLLLRRGRKTDTGHSAKAGQTHANL